MKIVLISICTLLPALQNYQPVMAVSLLFRISFVSHLTGSGSYLTVNLHLMYKALHLSPMIPSYNIEKTAGFFTSLLGFRIARDESNYKILSRDDLTIHIMNAGTDIGQMEFYLEVDQVDPLWADIKDKLAGIKFREPFDREYHMREFHIVVPYTETLLFVGQGIEAG